MAKCRICLAGKKTLMSIFDSNKPVSCATMMFSIANVKVHKDDGITDKICRFCRKSLTDAYELKILIERSDEELHSKENIKKINFGNIQDIKIKVEIDFTTDDKKGIPKLPDLQHLKNDENDIYYGDTTIKKVEIETENDGYQEPLPVLDFLKSIGEEPGDDDLNVDEDEEDYGPVKKEKDVDYLPPHLLLKNNKIKYQRKNPRKHIKLDHLDSDYGYDDDDDHERMNEHLEKPAKKKRKIKVQKVCIKPVLLNDLKPVLIIPKKEKKMDKQKQYRKLQICPYCGKMSGSLHSHILTHIGERKFKCDVCEKGFFNVSMLRHHVKATHAPTKDFKCDFCIAAFTTKSALRNHALKHAEEKKYVCSTCSKGFKRRETLRRHEMCHNVANKNVLCDQCNMSFFTKESLRHHQRIHTGERPFKCELCNQPYSYKHDFNRHCLKKHGIFLKRRSVYVMNEEVMKRERELMKNLLLKLNGVVQDDKPLNPFDGPQGYLAFEYAVRALQNNVISVDLNA